MNTYVKHYIQDPRDGKKWLVQREIAWTDTADVDELIRICELARQRQGQGLSFETGEFQSVAFFSYFPANAAEMKGIRAQERYRKQKEKEHRQRMAKRDEEVAALTKKLLDSKRKRT